jgi:hypothetical protein
MKIRTIVLATALMFGLYGIAQARVVPYKGATAVKKQEASHAAQALEHANASVASGEDAAAVTAHAEEALKHAEAGQQEKANPHLEEGITHLKAAIEHGKAGHADVAVGHAKEAVTHLKAATETK